MCSCQSDQRAMEFVDSRNHLHVPVVKSYDPAPKREGWKPRFVYINLLHPIQKVVLYERVNPTGSND